MNLYDLTIRFELTDPRAQNIVKLITESIQVDKLRFLFAMPFLRHIFPELTGWNKQKEVIILVEVRHKKFTPPPRLLRRRTL